MTDDDATDRRFIEMWCIEKYDEIVARYPNGIALEETRRIFTREYVAAVRSGDIPRVPFIGREKVRLVRLSDRVVWVDADDPDLAGLSDVEIRQALEGP